MTANEVTELEPGPELEEDEPAKVSPLLPKLKDLAMTGRERTAMLGLVDLMPVKKAAKARRAMALFKFFEGDDWGDWEIWQRDNDIDDDILEADYVLRARKKDLRMIVDIVEEAIDSEILHGRGLRQIAQLYARANGQELDIDDE